ncbi:P-loop containing nucleoside triphosphate hydrolase protein [Cantharellus anzutake]|uniref:P-loop containing nucleoside triphosphate hydrolase protein n=1 Tax=Cantharellus anzutake TaxID=1750568 RepID=UPI001906B341|nr:P-loop containing nucleoside triphosphate hydrolase protein [Cantharellus anzutake]KAF8323543.1 P-loop containing nucleoside triphosphate hydrolase protein [Cantharellus anzutake]
MDSRASAFESIPKQPAIGNDSLPWVEKYRPHTLQDVVSHGDITNTIQQFIKGNRLPHLLLYGPPGTGKTSMVLAMARQLYGDEFRRQILELNASDDRGIDVVRDQIKDFADSGRLYTGLKNDIKLIILDEADMMTQAAQAALRRVIEQYTRNVRFCIICNYVNKIIPAIQSRCTRFRFSPLPVEAVQLRLSSVIENERVNITEDGRRALLRISKGDMRRALNVLQACHAAYPMTDEAAVYSCTGTPHPSDIAAMVNSMLTDDFLTCYMALSKMKIERGLALQDLISGSFEYIQGLDLPAPARVYLLDKLAVTECSISAGSNEKLQLGGLIATFKHGVQMSVIR